MDSHGSEKKQIIKHCYSGIKSGNGSFHDSLWKRKGTGASDRQ